MNVMQGTTDSGPCGGKGAELGLAARAALAFAVLALYAVACFVFPAIATRRRDIL